MVTWDDDEEGEEDVVQPNNKVSSEEKSERREEIDPTQPQKTLIIKSEQKKYNILREF